MRSTGWLSQRCTNSRTWTGWKRAPLCVHHPVQAQQMSTPHDHPEPLGSESCWCGNRSEFL